MEANDREFHSELALLRQMGLKENPLRLQYEARVRALRPMGQALLSQGQPEEQVAQTLHGLRRELGRQYKEAAPPLFRAYIYFATAQKYGDPLGPSFQALRKRKTPAEIIASASRPIENLDDRLTIEGFRAWYHAGGHRPPLRTDTPP